MKLSFPLSLSLLLFSSALQAQQDAGLEFDGSGTADSYVTFPDDHPAGSRWATDASFTVQAIVRANPGCGVSGDFDIYSRIESSNLLEKKVVRLHDNGDISVFYRGSIDALTTVTPTMSNLLDGEWHHVAFVHGAGDLWSIYVDGYPEVNNAQGMGEPIEYSSGVETVIGNGDGWEITSLMVSDSALTDFTGMGPLSGAGDPGSILLLQFSANLEHDIVNSFPRSITGTLHGDAYWFNAVDFDGDGIDDADESSYGTHVADRDSDDDSLSDSDELWLNNKYGWTLDPANPDSDNDGIHDGCELGQGKNAGQDADATMCIGGTDSSVYQYDHHRATTTNPCDQDSDDDGFMDGEEDVNANGGKDAGELDAANPDTDDDYLQDGTEAGLDETMVGPDTDLSVFQPDEDTSTTTDNLNDDTDGGSLKDGQEDLNHNGAFDGAYETDPTAPMTIDDNWDLTHYDYEWYAGQHVYVDGWNLDQGYVILLFSTGAPGSSWNSQTDLTMNLAAPIRALPGTQTVDPDGKVRFQGTVPMGMKGVLLHLQGLEVVEEPGVGTAYRLSRNINRIVL